MIDLSWQRQANCIGADKRLFFPKQGESTKLAREICAACKVLPQCREYSLSMSLPYGIFAGLSPQERRKIRRERPLAPTG